MNGIAAMKRLKEELPSCKMVVISGYDEFRYAQEAIRLQVEDYILKPVNPEKLHQLLLEVHESLEKEITQQTYLRQAKSQLKKNYNQLMIRFFIDWIEEQLVQDEITEQLAFLDLPVEKPVQYMIIKWPEYHQNQTYMQENDRQVYLFAIENIVKELLEGKQAVVFRDRIHLLNVCLWDTIPQELIKKIEASIKEYLDITVLQHVVQVEGEITDLHIAYENCKEEVDSKLRISPIVKEAQEYVHEHYLDPSITLEKVAAALHISTVYLSRMMKQELGISYVGLLTQMRINKAADLLKTTDMTIRDISEFVGYDSQHYFSTTFKKITGVSPKQFKHAE